MLPSTAFESSIVGLQVDNNSHYDLSISMKKLTDVKPCSLCFNIREGQLCVANITNKMTVPTMKMTVTTMAQMRSSTAAASIQSFFTSFSLSSSKRCSSSLCTRVLRRWLIFFNSFFIDSSSVASEDDEGN